MQLSRKILGATWPKFTKFVGVTMTNAITENGADKSMEIDVPLEEASHHSQQLHCHYNAATDKRQ